MAEHTSAYALPWHVYANEPKPSTFHSGHYGQQVAEQAAYEANEKAKKLGIEIKYSAMKNPNLKEASD